MPSESAGLRPVGGERVPEEIVNVVLSPVFCRVGSWDWPIVKLHDFGVG